jgi:hypothetical protein
MVFDQAVVISIVSACIAGAAILVHKLKCVSNNGHLTSACSDSPIIASHSEIEVSIARLNGIDFMYVSNKHVEVNTDSSSESEYKSE